MSQADKSSQDQSQSKSIPKQHPTIKLLKQYHQKLQLQDQAYKQRIQAIRQKVFKNFQQKFSLQFSIFEKNFYKQRHQLTVQLKTVKYYLQNFLQKHSLNPRQNNLYPLFNEIDKKLNDNLSYIDNKFQFNFQFPNGKQQVNRNLDILKAEILEKELDQIRQFLVQNQNIKKYCTKELKQLKDIHEGYANVYTIAQKKYFTPDLQFIGSMEQVSMILKIQKNIEKLNLGIRTTKGKMSIQQYRDLFALILQSRNILTHITIKIMDMQFEQQKCCIVKQSVKELKRLKTFKIQNYYKENKLGMFEDFNWYPLKKQTHAVGKVW